MAKNENILSDDILVRKRGNEFVLILPEFGIVEKGSDFSEAYQRLLIRKEELLKELEEEGLLSHFLPRNKNNNYYKQPRSWVHELMLFTMKTTVLIIAFSFGLWVVLAPLEGKIKESAENFSNQFTSQFKGPDFVERLNNASDEKILKKKKQYELFVKKIEPLVEPFEPLLVKIRGKNQCR